MSCRTTIVPTGSVVTTSAPAIGDQPHTTTSSSTDEEQRADERAVEREEADVGETGARRGVPAAAALDRAHPRVEHRDERERGERRLQEEDAAPAEELGQEAAERGTDRDADRARERPRLDRVRVAPADAGQHRDRARRARTRRRGLASSRPIISTSNDDATPHTNDAPANTPSPTPASTWPRTRRSSASTPIAPTTIARLYAVIVHDTVTIETSNVP